MTVAGWILSEAAPGLSGPWYEGAPLLFVLLEFIPSQLIDLFRRTRRPIT